MIELNVSLTEFWQPFLALILSFFIAQGAKMLLDKKNHKKIIWWENGGMPSSHTAAVVALLTIIFLETGFSLLFLITATFASIVMNDAIGVRWETSKHSTYLNEQSQKKQFRIVGHTPKEVFFGALIGLLVPILVYVFV